MSDDLMPVTRFPGDATAQRWLTREEPPAVTVRCGRGKQSCDRLARIYETADGPIVVFHQHATDRPVELGLPDDGLPDGYEPSPTFKKFDVETRRGLIHGRRDDPGTAVSLEDDDGWADVVEASCRRHTGSVPLTRVWLMGCLRRARADRSGRLRVTVPE